MNLGQRIRTIRLRKKLKISDCAELVGVSPSTYRDWEYGRAINGEPYEKIAHALGVGLSDVLGVEPRQFSRDLQEIEDLAENLLQAVRKVRSHL